MPARIVYLTVDGYRVSEFDPDITMYVHYDYDENYLVTREDWYDAVTKKRTKRINHNPPDTSVFDMMDQW